MSEAAMYRPWAAGATAMEAPLDARMAFVRRTYFHVAGAAVLLTGLSAALYQSGIGATMLDLLVGMGTIGMILWVVGQMAVGWVGRTLAQSERPVAVQYLGLGITTTLWALILAPLLFLAGRYAPEVIGPAAGLTIAGFTGISAYAVLSRKDFSFIGGILTVVGFVILGVIVCSMIFDFSTAIWMPSLCILFACGAILYQTSAILHNYRTDEHVAAALELFTWLAYLFFQILLLLLQTRRRE